MTEEEMQTQDKFLFAGFVRLVAALPTGAKKASDIALVKLTSTSVLLSVNDDTLKLPFIDGGLSIVLNCIQTLAALCPVSAIGPVPAASLIVVALISDNAQAPTCCDG